MSLNRQLAHPGAASWACWPGLERWSLFAASHLTADLGSVSIYGTCLLIAEVAMLGLIFRQWIVRPELTHLYLKDHWQFYVLLGGQ